FASVALYTEDALFYGGRPRPAVGHAEVREYFYSYIGTLESAPLAFVDQEQRKIGGGGYFSPGYPPVHFVLHCRGCPRTLGPSHSAAFDIGSDASSRRVAHRPASFFVTTFRTAYSSPTSSTELNQHLSNLRRVAFCVVSARWGIGGAASAGSGRGTPIRPPL